MKIFKIVYGLLVISFLFWAGLEYFYLNIFLTGVLAPTRETTIFFSLFHKFVLVSSSFSIIIFGINQIKEKPYEKNKLIIHLFLFISVIGMTIAFPVVESINATSDDVIYSIGIFVQVLMLWPIFPNRMKNFLARHL